MRRKRERELERERDVQTTVFETIPSVMVVLARDGTIRDRDAADPRVGANRAFRLALGWPGLRVGRASVSRSRRGGRRRAGGSRIAAAAGRHCVRRDRVRARSAPTELAAPSRGPRSPSPTSLVGPTGSFSCRGWTSPSGRRLGGREGARARLSRTRSRTTRRAFCASSTMRASSPSAVRTRRSSGRSSTTRARSAARSSGRRSSIRPRPTRCGETIMRSRAASRRPSTTTSG